MYRKAAFTFIEVITVLVLSSLLAAALMLTLNDDNDIREEADLLRIRIRYAQSRAMGESTPYGIICNGAQYTIFRGQGAETTSVFPGESSINYIPPRDITTPEFIVSFDEWGVPYADTTQTTPLNADLNITLSTIANDANLSEVITITQVTGFVP